MIAALALLALAHTQQPADCATGYWDAWLDSPGGELHFGLELPVGPSSAAYLVNGEERIAVPHVSFDRDQGELLLEMPHYDSRVRARSASDGLRLDGAWTRIGGGGKETRMAFHARHVGPARLRGSTEVSRLAGRWAVTFEGDEDLAVAEFRGHPAHAKTAGELRGTFLTTLGDYRYLAGSLDGTRLELSCFDGAHAFLFKGELGPHAEIEGEFWSRDTWHQRWSAVRDPDAALPDPFGLTSWNEDVKLASLVFPDLHGRERSLADPAFAGEARLLALFGTWCPNCNDEAPYLAELERRYRARGLRVLGLAFEHTGVLERDAEQVRRYAKRHGIEFPLLLAGTSDKREASRRFPLIDRVRAFPTTIFMRGDGTVRAVHTGFAGPAAGAEHQKLREDFERLLEELLEAGE